MTPPCQRFWFEDHFLNHRNFCFLENRRWKSVTDLTLHARGQSNGVWQENTLTLWQENTLAPGRAVDGYNSFWLLADGYNFQIPEC